MKLLALLSILLLASASFAGFTYLEFYNGTETADNSDVYRFYQPTGVLYDSGKLYIGDSGRGALYIYDTETRAREKAIIGEGGTGPVQNPLRMAFESGVLYIADGVSSNVKTYSGEGFNINKLIEGSNLEKPSGLALDSQNYYIADIAKKRVYVYLRSTRIYQRVALDAGPSDGELGAPADIELYEGKFYVSDSEKNVVFVYDQNFTPISTIGRGRGGVTLSSPRGLEVFDGRIYVADSVNNRVVVFSLDGYPLEILDKGTPEGNLSSPEDLAVAGGRLYVAEGGSKLVKAFSINYTVKNDSVLQAIQAANASVQRLVQLQSIADRLNIPYESTDSLLEISMALADYDNYLFSSASALAAKALASSESVQQALQQDIEVRVLQLSKESEEKVAPYRGSGMDGVQEKIAQFDNRVADIKVKLAANSYASAADSALGLSSLAGEIESLVSGKKAQEISAVKNQTFAGFSLDYSGLLARLNAAKQKALQYRQAPDLENSELLLNRSLAEAASGDFDSANYSLALVRLEMSSIELSLDTAAAEIDAALLNISSYESGIKELSAKPSLVPANLAPEMLVISQAKESVYSNAPLAVESARLAGASAGTKAAEAQALSLAVSAVLVIVFLIGALALSFFLHLRRRKARMQQEAVEEAEKELHPELRSNPGGRGRSPLDHRKK